MIKFYHRLNTNGKLIIRLYMIRTKHDNHFLAYIPGKIKLMLMNLECKRVGKYNSTLNDVSIKFHRF